MVRVQTAAATWQLQKIYSISSVHTHHPAVPHLVICLKDPLKIYVTALCAAVKKNIKDPQVLNQVNGLDG